MTCLTSVATVHKSLKKKGGEKNPTLRNSEVQTSLQTSPFSMIARKTHSESLQDFENILLSQISHFLNFRLAKNTGHIICG